MIIFFSNFSCLTIRLLRQEVLGFIKFLWKMYSKLKSGEQFGTSWMFFQTSFIMSPEQSAEILINVIFVSFVLVKKFWSLGNLSSFFSEPTSELLEDAKERQVPTFQRIINRNTFRLVSCNGSPESQIFQKIRSKWNPDFFELTSHWNFQVFTCFWLNV